MATVQELETLLGQARAGTLKPLVLVYGDQDYMVRQAYDRLLEALVPEEARAFNVEQHDGSKVEPQPLLDTLATPPMMGGAKAVGVYDARFFQSKANLGDVLAKAREKWLAGENAVALRHLGRAVSLAGWTWEEAAAAGAPQWAEALGLSESEFESQGGAWLPAALAEAVAGGAAAPSGGDDSGALAEGLEALLDHGLAGATLVCATASADARKRLFKLFQERGQVLDFKTADKGPQANLTARAFLALSLKKRNLTVKAAVGERLCSAYGHDLGLLERELEKLEAWAYPRTELTDADIAAVGGPRPEDDVFKLLDALGRRDLGEALRLQRRFLRQDPQASFEILYRLVGEVRRLLLMRALLDEGHVAARAASDYNSFKMQTHPKLSKELPPALAALVKRSHAFPLFQALSRAKAFDKGQLRDLVQGLAEADVQIKTGTAEARAVLEALCLRLCGVREEAVL
jgi:DNA polymerase-3 subunit delta